MKQIKVTCWSVFFSMISEMNGKSDFFHFPRPCIWKYELVNTCLLSFKVKDAFVPPLGPVKNVSTWINHPKIHDLLVSRANVPSSSHSWGNSLNVFVEYFLLSTSNHYSQHILWFKISHINIPLIHNRLLISFSVRNLIRIFNFDGLIYLNSLSSTWIDFQSFLFNTIHNIRSLILLISLSSCLRGRLRLTVLLIWWIALRILLLCRSLSPIVLRRLLVALLRVGLLGSLIDITCSLGILRRRRRLAVTRRRLAVSRRRRGSRRSLS